MDRYKNHFLDSCTIIGKLLDFDTQYEHAEKYFNRKFKRHTSNGVCDEIINRLNEVRREILGFIEWIKKEEFKGLQTDDRIISFIHRYNPLNNIEKNRKMLNNFYQKYLSEIKSFIIENNFDIITEIIKIITNAIGTAQDDLTYLTDFSHEHTVKIHVCPDIYVGEYNVKYSEVRRIINYHPDTKVLLDSYYVKDEIIKQDLGFITTDKDHILSNKSKIESLLSGLFIFDMRTAK